MRTIRNISTTKTECGMEKNKKKYLFQNRIKARKNMLPVGIMLRFENIYIFNIVLSRDIGSCENIILMYFEKIKK